MLETPDMVNGDRIDQAIHSGRSTVNTCLCLICSGWSTGQCTVMITALTPITAKIADLIMVVKTNMELTER